MSSSSFLSPIATGSVVVDHDALEQRLICRYAPAEEPQPLALWHGVEAPRLPMEEITRPAKARITPPPSRPRVKVQLAAGSPLEEALALLQQAEIHGWEGVEQITVEKRGVFRRWLGTGGGDVIHIPYHVGNRLRLDGLDAVICTVMQALEAFEGEMHPSSPGQQLTTLFTVAGAATSVTGRERA